MTRIRRSGHIPPRTEARCCSWGTLPQPGSAPVLESKKRPERAERCRSDRRSSNQPGPHCILRLFLTLPEARRAATCVLFVAIPCSLQPIAQRGVGRPIVAGATIFMKTAPSVTTRLSRFHSSSPRDILLRALPYILRLVNN
jgi:hypothetical protein